MAITTNNSMLNALCDKDIMALIKIGVPARKVASTKNVGSNKKPKTNEIRVMTNNACLYLLKYLFIFTNIFNSSYFTWYPSCSIMFTTSCRLIFVSSMSAFTFELLNNTLTLSSPSSLLSRFSILLMHDGQLTGSN